MCCHCVLAESSLAGVRFPKPSSYSAESTEEVRNIELHVRTSTNIQNPDGESFNFGRVLGEFYEHRDDLYARVRREVPETSSAFFNPDPLSIKAETDGCATVHIGIVFDRFYTREDLVDLGMTITAVVDSINPFVSEPTPSCFRIVREDGVSLPLRDKDGNEVSH
jgi:hypothetical protein